MSTDPLPPEPLEVQAARQVRIDSDIIKLCCKPKPPYTIPTVHGIGLYTHVAGPKIVQQNPHGIYADRDDGEVALLPLGGPHKILPSKSLNKEVAAIYKKLQDAVQAEEKIWNDMRAAAEAKGEAAKDAYKMSLETLKKKYGDINTPTSESAKLQQDHSQQNKRRLSEAVGSGTDEVLKRRRVSFAQHSEARQQSTDVSMGGTGTHEEKQERASKAGNMYEAYRDPRRQGR
ncbi:uncharacterized protein EKO05_0008560 [Ascochyta rabiei]|uniref:Uncharacterized protein n=1 Tax=Didymella rabiei TaxID=5454 RepID=A0A163MMX5_DIDRA|nr:uncharacterized protein EKO05_0008560 [Ascochyta rabiei]KZM28854.1 hypothetical protein ST47_g37 [Ascochyta rabiei]UPX18254.1 hypothetical protein EKO05_0008560 [Ascochyta rabiei]